MTMKAFTKIIRPFTTSTIDGRTVPVFFKIVYGDGGKLSITGVEGPTPNGNCYGEFGQLINNDWKIDTLADGWSYNMVCQFRAIWQAWHLNNLRPYSPEMKDVGWDKKALTPMSVYVFTRTRELSNECINIEKDIMATIRAGESFTPTPEQVAVLSTPLTKTIWTYEGEPQPAPPEGMERVRYTTGPDAGAIMPPNSTTLGWLKPNEHPDGLLGLKINPNDSHGYGERWWTENVPDDTLNWLKNLPDTDKNPAWV